MIMPDGASTEAINGNAAATEKVTPEASAAWCLERIGAVDFKQAKFVPDMRFQGIVPGHFPGN